MVLLLERLNLLFLLWSTTWICCIKAFVVPATFRYVGKQRGARQQHAVAQQDAPPLFVDETRANVQDYYGEKLQSSSDLATNACCTGVSPPGYIQDCINNVHPETLRRYYGCGLCLPLYDLDGCSVLDLGCGAGRDVYIAAQLVGEHGKVVGVDMTERQLEIARDYQPYHSQKFGYENTQFVQGYLESLDEIKELQPGSFDVIISNCVLNLCTDKSKVLRSCYGLLKPGGEMYFSDVYANRRVPESLQRDPILWGECLSGALYWNDFEHKAKDAGFRDPRLVEDSPVTVSNATVQRQIASSGNAALQFYSATYRLFKMNNLEPDCEDYGQAVVYRGTIPRAESVWVLDKHHLFEKGRIHPVCGNTWSMLEQNPRLQPHFDFIGNFDHHYGIFEGCGPTVPFTQDVSSPQGATKQCC